MMTNGEMHLTLRSTIDDLLAAYGEHLIGNGQLVDYTLNWVDGSVTLKLPVPHTEDGTTEGVDMPQQQEIVGHLSAWKQLAGRYWAAVLMGDAVAVIPAYIPSLLSRPGSGGGAWEPFCNLLDDKRIHRAMEASAAFLLEQGREIEAEMCAKSITFSMEDMDGGVVEVAIREALEAKGSLSTLAGLKIATPFLHSERAEERLAALSEILGVFRGSRPNNCLTAHKLLIKYLQPLWRDPEPLVREGAIAVAERWVPEVMVRSALQEAMTLLDALIEYGVGIADNLRGRFQLRLAIGDPDGAERDWQAILITHPPDHPVQLGGMDQGTLQDYRALALSLGAQAQLQYAEGADPCAERTITAKHRDALLEPAQYRDRARQYLDEALEIIRASSDTGEVGSGYRSITLGTLATLQEQESDLANAAKNYRLANDMSVAGGVAWHRDRYLEKAIELEGQLATAVAGSSATQIPGAFDPDWFIDPNQADTTIEAALGGWGTPWSEFPSDAEAALSTPLAALLISRLGPLGLPWQKIEALGLEGYEDYESFTRTNAMLAGKFQQVLDMRVSHPDFDPWHRIFDTQHLDSLFGWRWDGRKDTSHPAWRDDLKYWLQSILDATTGDQAAALRGVPTRVYEHMGEQYRATAAYRYRDHFLAWAMWEATGDTDCTRQLYTAFRPLFEDVWANTAIPKAAYLKDVEPLRQEGTQALTSALVRFTQVLAKPPMDHMPLVPEKWLWPWALVWHPSMEAPLIEHLSGDWDHKKIKRAKRGRRLDAIGWLLSQVDAPELAAVYEPMRTKHDNRGRK